MNNLKWFNQTLLPIVMMVFVILTLLMVISKTRKVSEYQKYSIRQTVVVDLNNRTSYRTISDIQKNIKSMTHQDTKFQTLDDNNKVYVI